MRGLVSEIKVEIEKDSWCWPMCMCARAHSHIHKHIWTYRYKRINRTWWVMECWCRKSETQSWWPGKHVSGDTSLLPGEFRSWCILPILGLLSLRFRVFNKLDIWTWDGRKIILVETAELVREKCGLKKAIHSADQGSTWVVGERLYVVGKIDQDVLLKMTVGHEYGRTMEHACSSVHLQVFCCAFRQQLSHFCAAASTSESPGSHFLQALPCLQLLKALL